MKIEKIICQVLRVQSVEKKTASSQDVVLVRVRSDTGLEGIGEADASPEVVKAIVRSRPTDRGCLEVAAFPTYRRRS